MTRYIIAVVTALCLALSAPAAAHSPRHLRVPLPQTVTVETSAAPCGYARNELCSHPQEGQIIARPSVRLSVLYAAEGQVFFYDYVAPLDEARLDRIDPATADDPFRFGELYADCVLIPNIKHRAYYGTIRGSSLVRYCAAIRSAFKHGPIPAPSPGPDYEVAE